MPVDFAWRLMYNKNTMKKGKIMRKTKQRSTVVLFDWDGTLSAGDTNVGFWRYCMRHSVWPWLFLPVALAGVGVQFIAFISARATIRLPYASGPHPRIRFIDILWRQMLRLYLTPKMVKKFVPKFVKQYGSQRFGWAAEQVAKERAAGNIVILTSASPDFLLMPLIADIEFDFIINSQMDPARPWKFWFFNYGTNKVIMLNILLKHGTFDVVRAYSDSRSDIPMMSLAREQIWINQKTGCRENAP